MLNLLSLSSIATNYRGFLFLILLRGLSSSTADISYLILALFACFGPIQGIQALTLSWFFAMLNPSIFPSSSFAPLGKYLIVFACLFGCLLRRRASGVVYERPFLYLTLGWVIFLVLHSFLASQVTGVSVLKALSWSFAMLASIIAWGMVTRHEREILIAQVFLVFHLILFVSVALPIFGMGSEVNGNLQGLLNQPQALGPTIALLFVWLASRILARPFASVLDYVKLVLCFVVILMSGARTGALAAIFGISIASVLYSVFNPLRLATILPGLFTLRSVIVFGFILVSSVSALSWIANSFGNFFAKGGESSDLTDAYNGSRGALIDAMLTNVQTNPFVGIGFGVSSFPEQMEIERDPFFGIPISAPIEKGVMPIAILEEVGVVGFIFFAAWSFFVFRKGGRSGLSELAVSITIFWINLGESVLFSPGGLGLIHIVLISWAATTPTSDSKL